MIEKIKNIYFNELFNPGFIGVFVNPFYFARKSLYKNISLLAPNLNGKLLDVGCESKPYLALCNNVSEYIGLEISDEGNRNNRVADVLYDGKTMPFDEEEFDCVMTNQVFEHVFNPNTFLKEINRVTKMEGVMLLTVPFVWDEHGQPYDYARYSFFGLKHILNKHGFEIRERSNDGLAVVFQLVNAYIFKITETRNPYLNLLRTLLLISPINIMGIILSKILPRNKDLYLDNIVLVKKIKNV